VTRALSGSVAGISDLFRACFEYLFVMILSGNHGFIAE
jgi:hypothetical protein